MVDSVLEDSETARFDLEGYNKSLMEDYKPLNFRGPDSYLKFLQEQFENQCFLLEQNNIPSPHLLPLDQFYSKLRIINKIREKSNNK